MDLIEKAFSKVNRQNFVLKSYRDMANIDSPLPIGYGQTISQPSTVKLMLEWLNVRKDEKVLDVGSGSGWTTALLSEIIGPQGKIFAVERILELVQFGKNNCEKIGVKNARFFQSGNGYGLPQYAPYDRILVSASSEELPTELLEQLKIGGKLVVPVADDILEITKKSAEDIGTIVHPGFIFVPLIKHH